MSQQQPERPQQEQPTPVRYGDVFDVSSELSSQPIAPKDACTMQAEENRVLGKTLKGGAAAVMQSAAAVNLQRGVVGRDEAKDHGVMVSQDEVAGKRIITEAVGGEVSNPQYKCEIFVYALGDGIRPELKYFLNFFIYPLSISLNCFLNMHFKIFIYSFIKS